MAIERDDDFYLSLSLNEQMLWLYEEIEQTIKANPEHEALQCDVQDSCGGCRIDRLFRIIKEDPKNRALLREIDRAEREWRAYIAHASDALSKGEIIDYWKQYPGAFCAEWDERSQVLYFLMRGYDVCHDGDEWLGMYDSIWKLKASYREAVRELEEEHKKCTAEGLRVTHERVMIHAFDQAAKKWNYDVQYEALFPEQENALPQGVKIPQFLKTVVEE